MTGAFALVLSTTGCGIAVPDVKAMTVDQAAKTLDAAGFEVGRVTYDEDATGAIGAVVAQQPESGKRLGKGSLVILTVAGAAPVPTPNLVGLDSNGAAAALTATGLTVGEVTQSYDASTAAGLVASQTPTAGELAPPGSTVAMSVSLGPTPVDVPNVKGEKQAQATEILEAAGFKVKAKKISDDKVDKGKVIKQKPEGGEKAQPGTTVAIAVSKGTEMIRVPNVEDYDTASDTDERRLAAALKRMGLRIRWVDRGWTSLPGPNPMDAADMAGSFYGQSPRAGVRVPKGSTVRVTRVIYPPNGE